MHLAEFVEDSRSTMEGGQDDVCSVALVSVGYGVLRWTREALTCRVCHSNMLEKISSLYLVINRSTSTAKAPSERFHVPR